MNKVSFFTPVKFNSQFPTVKNKLLEACDGYLSLGHRVAQVQYEIDKERVYSVIECHIAPSSVFQTALKVVSYFTVILPLLALCAKFFLRTTTDFNYLNQSSLRSAKKEFLVPPNMTLEQAAECGDLDRVRQLLGPFTSHEDRGYAIKKAALKGHLDVVLALIPQVAPEQERARDLALQYFAEGGHREIVFSLLQTEEFRESKNHAVFGAATLGDLIFITYLVHGFDVAQSNEAKEYAFLGFSFGGHLKLIQEQCESKVINNQELRFEAIDLAASRGHLPVFNYLMGGIGDEYRKEVNSRVFKIAAQEGHLSIVLALINSEDIETYTKSFAIEEATKKGHLDIVLAIVNSGISEYDRSKVLVELTRLGHLELIEAVIASGSICSFQLNEAIDVAARGQSLPLIQLLLSKVDPYILKLAKEKVVETAVYAHRDNPDFVTTSLIQAISDNPEEADLLSAKAQEVFRYQSEDAFFGSSSSFYANAYSAASASQVQARFSE
jgi:hypothetical protein